MMFALGAVNGAGPGGLCDSLRSVCPVWALASSIREAVVSAIRWLNIGVADADDKPEAIRPPFHARGRISWSSVGRYIRVAHAPPADTLCLG
jgi:hypothetical protein